MTWLRQARRALGVTAVVALAGLATAAPARAGYLGAYSGNTQPQHQPPGSGVSGTVNFAVFDMTTGGGGAGDTYGTGASIDSLFVQSGAGNGIAYGTGRYLYLYQTVNNGPSSGSFPISTNTVFVTPSFVGSFGTVTGTSFSTDVLGTAAGFGDPSAASTGAAPTLLTGQAGLTTPTLELGLTSLVARFKPEVTQGNKSVLWGFVSDLAPAMFTTGLIDGGTTGSGVAPSAAVVPEPSAIVLSLIGLPFGLLLRRRATRA